MIVTTTDVAQWVCDRIRQPNHEKYACFGWVEDGKISAGFIFDNFNGSNVYAHAAGRFIGAYYFDEFMSAIWDYTFRQLAVKRVTATIKSTNSKSLNLARNIGFVEEVVMVDMFPKCDVVQLKLVKQNCRWLS